MRQLARLSMGLPAMDEPPPLPPPPGGPPEGIPAGPPRGYTGAWPPPVTTQPRLPVPQPSTGDKLLRLANEHRSVALAVVALAIALPLVWIIARAPFVADPQPPIQTTEARPLPVNPNLPIAAAFGMLGTLGPVANPDSRFLARYTWSEGITADALNGMIYAVTLTEGARSWRGLRVGDGEDATRGALALLGPVRTPTVGAQRGPILLDGYQTLSTLDERPIRRVVAEIRPPNGCLDVIVTLTPRAIGRLRQRQGDMWAIARGSAPFEWVVGTVRIVSRAVPGPYAGGPDCDPPNLPQPLGPGFEPAP